MEQQHMLSGWEQSPDGAWLYRLAASGMAVGAIGPYGWTVLNRKALVVGSGNETGRAGQAAADACAMRMAAESPGPAARHPPQHLPPRSSPTPMERVIALQDEVARLTAELAERTRERDYWASEAQRLRDASLEVERLRSVASRVADLERAIVAMALRMGER